MNCNCNWIRIYQNIDSNDMALSTANGMIISQLINFARVCSTVNHCIGRNNFIPTSVDKDFVNIIDFVPDKLLES